MLGADPPEEMPAAPGADPPGWASDGEGRKGTASVGDRQVPGMGEHEGERVGAGKKLTERNR